MLSASARPDGGVSTVTSSLRMSRPSASGNALFDFSRGHARLGLASAAGDQAWRNQRSAANVVRKILAFVTQPSVIRKILEHCGFTSYEVVLTPARSPPGFEEEISA